MNITSLRTFLAIVETGSLVRASARLNVTQSTVTARLHALEDALGQTLLNRPKSGVTLTAAGVRLYRYAETISDLWDQARQEAALPGAFGAVCNIGCHPDLWPDLGARMFDHIRQNEPAVALSVAHGGQAELKEWMKSGLVDVILSFWPAADPKQDVLPLMTDRLCLVSTDPASPVKFDPGYVFVENGAEFSRHHAAAYADANTARLNFGSAALGLDHILAHGGTAYLPLRMARPHLDAGRLHLIADAPEFSRPSYVIVNSNAVRDWPWFATALPQI